MNTQDDIDRFLRSTSLAVIGVSRERRGFGYTVFHDLRAKGYRVFPVNPATSAIDGETCYAGVASLPEKVDGVVLVVPPPRTEEVVREIAAAGISQVWMQQGAESEAAIAYCHEQEINAIHGQCIMMFARPAALPHRVHRWIRKATGSLPR